MRFNRSTFLLLILFLLLSPSLASAQNFSSNSYTVSNPVLFPAGYSTSPNFSLSAVISQMAIGSSTSGSLYQLFAGFLYFPFVSTPTVSATPGNTQVALTWTSADASTGWTVGSYAVGQATAPGGPYAFTDVGNVVASTRTGLTNGSTYYFVVRVADALGNAIATSTEVSAVPVAPTGGGSGGGGGGGSGGGGSGGGTGGNYGNESIRLSGRAYPHSTVTVLQDAQVVTTTVADAGANFQVSLSNLSAGNYFFSVYSEDNAGNRSSLLTFPVSVITGAATNITGIFIAPTIDVDKSQVKKGDNIAIFGQTAAKSDVTIQVNSDQPYFAKTTSDASGAYLYNFDTVPLEYGDHSTKSKTALVNEISSYSLAVPFAVGNSTILKKLSGQTKVCDKKGDVNTDCKVNLVDFSIVAYWYNRPSPPQKVDINGDGKINLIDFSILAFNWTG